MMGYKIETNFDESVITQDVVSKTGDASAVISKQIINLKDQGVRDALIAMGWTPPADDKGHENDKN